MHVSVTGLRSRSPGPALNLNSRHEAASVSGSLNSAALSRHFFFLWISVSEHLILNDSLVTDIRLSLHHIDHHYIVIYHDA